MRGCTGAIAIFLNVSVATATILVLLGGGVALTVAPFEIGTIRLAGVSLLWWYGVILAPLIAVAVTVAAIARGGERAATPASPVSE